MRITNQMTRDRVLNDLYRSMAAVLKAQEQLSSAKRVNRPSDDPFATQKAISSRSSIMLLSQYKSNISELSTWVSASEHSLYEINRTLQDVRDLTVRAANGTLTREDLNVSATVVDEYRETVFQFAREQVGGRYLFSGTLTGNEPFTWTGADVTYNGNTDGMVRNIGPGASVRINVTGEEVFMNIGAPPESIFKMLNDLAGEMRGGDTSRIGGYLSRIDDAIARLLDKVGELGATTDRLEKMNGVLDGFIQSQRAQLSDSEDLDLAEGVMNFQLRDNAYQATLAACARIIMPSLIDYLK